MSKYITETPYILGVVQHAQLPVDESLPATGWNSHHLTPKYMGSHNTDENLVLLLPDSHIQVHDENLHIPAPLRCPSGTPGRRSPMR